MTSTDTESSAPLGRNIRAEMVRKGISQEALAKRLGLSQAAVSKRLRGEVELRLSEALAIADHLGVTLDRLLDGVER